MSQFNNPGLEGNPHFIDITCLSETAEQQVSATLALAYEQRTANLIAVFGQLMDGETETFLGERIDGYELAQLIQERLGK